MHNNFYFLRQLSKKLEETIAGFTLVSCFTQDKDELLIEFNDSRKSLFIKASLTSEFCCLSFPEKYHRAKKNSMDLFPFVVLKKVVGVRQFENERSFSIILESNLNLLFKMHGVRGNVVLFEKNKPLEIFRNHLTADLQLNLDAMDRSIDFSEEHFKNHQEDLKKSYFTFGKEVWSFLTTKGFDEADVAQRWDIFSSLLQKLENPEYFIVREKEKPVFTLLPGTEVIEQFQEPLTAVTRFYSERQKSVGFSTARSAALSHLDSQISACLNFLQKNRQKLNELNNDIHYQRWGDLIMANLEQIKTGMESVVLQNLYDDHRPVEIKLKKELNAAANAETYYRKAKNRQIEIQKLRESIVLKEHELKKIQLQKARVEIETSADGLSHANEEAALSVKKKELRKSLPYHEFEFKGFKIWVGKNAQSNDALTLKYSFKDDLWLHARDVAGSHVLVKYQAGKNFPKDVIQRAAELAAYNSKRKTDSLCPVSVTSKKFVRKRKGDPAGAVVVDREEVILVEPKL